MKIDENIRWLIILLILGFILSLGPVFKINEQTFKIFNLPIPLPYGIFYYIIPGFKAFRAPSRWLWVSAFAASGLASAVFSKLKIKHKGALMLVVIAVSIVFGSRIKRVYEVPQYKQYPHVYTWLESQSKDVIIEMPVYTWASGGLAKNEMMRMLYSLKHGKTLYNGYAGFYPPGWLRFTARLDKEFPSLQLESDLNEIGIDYVLVNKKEYGQTRLNAIKLWGEDKEVYQDKSFLVYKI